MFLLKHIIRVQNVLKMCCLKVLKGRLFKKCKPGAVITWSTITYHHILHYDHIYRKHIKFELTKIYWGAFCEHFIKKNDCVTTVHFPCSWLAFLGLALIATGTGGIKPCVNAFGADQFKEDQVSMMTSSNGNIFRVTGTLCGEFTGHRWIPITKASDAERWYFV